MSRELVCITCPIGCRLSVEGSSAENLAVSGNRCPRGAVYAREELFSPKRVVTATIRLRLGDAGKAQPHRAAQYAAVPRRLPVKTTAPLAREKIPELLNLIAGLEIEAPVQIGAVLAKDLYGTGIDLVATRNVGVD
jgi:CxxC motif-containing protein